MYCVAALIAVFRERGTARPARLIDRLLPR
jgi:hypothetical protein